MRGFPHRQILQLNVDLQSSSLTCFSECVVRSEHFGELGVYFTSRIGQPNGLPTVEMDLILLTVSDHLLCV